MRRMLAKELLIELMKNSKESDRKIARKLRVSQPTITRTRNKIEREGLIRNYSIIPNWSKLGCELMVMTFVKMRPEVVSDELFKKLQEYAVAFQNVIFASRGHGLGMTGVILSIHKDYRDYAIKLGKFRKDWAKYLEDTQSFLMVTDEGVIKELSFTSLGESLR
jgi:DNA-binding Lrp family transcriptional regulator